MVVHKRKKNTRHRGSHTHGWGNKKKHRGSGNRGGAGNASTGKRSDARKPVIWKNKDYFGKHGFIFKGLKEEIRPINITQLEENLERFLMEKKVEERNNTYYADLQKLGYHKLLGEGRVYKKWDISVAYASKNAIEKIQKASGHVHLGPEKGEHKIIKTANK